jgi:hypothetical protein
VIADRHSPVEDHPRAIEPVDPRPGGELTEAKLGPGQAERWTPEAAPSGPISIVLSSADSRIIVFRNGVEIGRARLSLPDPTTKFGTHAFVYLDAGEKRADAAPRWVQVGLPGHEAERGKQLSAQAIADVSIPPDFLKQLRTILVPGTTILVTDEAVLEQTTGVQTTVVTNDAPEPQKAVN